MKQKIDKWLPYLAMFVFILLIVFQVVCSGAIKRVDVAHAWTIAGHCNIIQLIDLMKYEGHFLLWYLCLMPFAKFNMFYPAIMHVLNISFCAIGIWLVWKKAPFNNLIKLIITFSSPIIFYAVQPRCYGLGVMLLLFVCTLYTNRLTNPYKYLTALILCANTSLPACIAAGYLGFLFLCDLLINKNFKAFWIAVTVAILNLILFYFQFSGVQIPDYETKVLIKAPYFVSAYLGLEENLSVVDLLKMIFLWLTSVIFSVMIFKSKRAFSFFLASSTTLILFFTFIYEARPQHVVMIWFYVVVAFWIFKLENFEKKYFDWRSNLFFILAFPLIFVSMNYKPEGLYYIVDDILQDKNLQSAKLFTNFYPHMVSTALPYLNKANQTFYDLKGRDLASYEGLKTYFDKNERIIRIETFVKQLDSSRDNFIILNGRFATNKMQVNDFEIVVEPYKILESDFSYIKNKPTKFYIYKIIKN